MSGRVPPGLHRSCTMLVDAWIQKIAAPSLYPHEIELAGRIKRTFGSPFRDIYLENHLRLSRYMVERLQEDPVNKESVKALAVLGLLAANAYWPMGVERIAKDMSLGPAVRVER